MSDPKRANIITVGAPKAVKKNVTITVRLNINLDESNESKYPELNYKELVIKQDKKQKSTVENGKTEGLDPFSDNDEDVERVARKFEQKYGGNSTYGKKRRPKKDDFADIGAGYDENDSFIDNTDGYDEMIPPEIDTLYGGFYINSGSLEFKTVPENSRDDDSQLGAGRRNKRRISSSSGVDTSESSSESDSPDEKDTKPQVNGAAQHRKKKKKDEMKKAKKIRRTDSSAANSGKQTSDDNVHGDGDSADSRTSDSLTSKPAPSSENPITSDSSRDVAEKPEQPLPPAVRQIIDDMKSCVPKSTNTPDHIDSCYIPFLLRLNKALSTCSKGEQKSSWAAVARLVNTTKNKLINKVKSIKNNNGQQTEAPNPLLVQSKPTPSAPPLTKAPSTNNKRKSQLDLTPEAISQMTADQKEEVIVDALQRLKLIIEERQPSMIASYNAECERIQEERKKLQSITPGAPATEISKRLPKRRFPWCGRSRSILCTVSKVAGDTAHGVLLKRVLPLFPKGFVRMPTLLRQAEIKAKDLQRQRENSSIPPALPQPPPLQPAPLTSNTEHIHFPTSLTVTTTTKPSPDKLETKPNNIKQESVYGPNPFSFFKDDKVDIYVDTNKKTDPYIPPNNIGGLTITPVNNTKPEKEKPKEPLIRVKSPAALLKDPESQKKMDKKNKLTDRNTKEKLPPLHIDTNFFKDKKESQPSPTPSNKKVNEDTLPRPALVPVHHSPTFAKPDKRPPEKKRKEQLPVDPLMETESVSIDDSSSDVELVEDKCEESEVPFKDKARSMDVDHVNEMDSVMRGLREIENFHEPKFSSKSFGGVITNAKQASAKAKQVRSDSKLTE